MPQTKWPPDSFLLPSTLPLSISSTYESTFIWTKIRLLSKGQSDKLKEKYTLLDLCPLGYKYSEQTRGGNSLSAQTDTRKHVSSSFQFPPPLLLKDNRENQASPCYWLHDLSMESICFATGGSRHAGLSRGKHKLSKLNHQ